MFGFGGKKEENPDPIIGKTTLGPGGVAVVGPTGVLEIHQHRSGRTCVVAVKVDFLDPPSENQTDQQRAAGAYVMSDAHKALVDERWALRTHDGWLMPDPKEQVVKGSISKFLARFKDAPPDPDIKKRGK